MAIEVITDFIAGATVRVIAYIYDDDGDLVNVGTSIHATIIDSSASTQASASTMSEAATGVYEYYHNTGTDGALGRWRGLISTISGGKTDIDRFGFKVRA